LSTPDLDDFDRRIIAALTANARLTNLELARKISLSHSAISRRIRRLEGAGVLKGYRASVDRAALGIGIRAFVGVARRPAVPAIEVARDLQTIDAIVGCWIVSGDFDIFVEIEARDMEHFSAVMLDRVQTTRGVAATRSMFVLSALKGD
jgi:Lrp/AsnC family leucine-responsive transcriptional regulator